jgi:hypothetical protein
MGETSPANVPVAAVVMCVGVMCAGSPLQTLVINSISSISWWSLRNYITSAANKNMQHAFNH